jgi:hypothetical protein
LEVHHSQIALIVMPFAHLLKLPDFRWRDCHLENAADNHATFQHVGV